MKHLSAARSTAMSRESPLTVLSLAALTSLVLAFVPGLGLLNIPFRLLLTMVHELGHGLAALLTGGAFHRFVVFPNGSGLAHTSGGWRVVVVAAGYLGTAAFGALLISLSRNVRASRTTLLVIGGALLLLTLRYATPSLLSTHWLSGILTVAAGLVLGGSLIWAARNASSGLALFLLNVLALEAVLMAFSDLFTLIGISTMFFNAPSNDAQAMAELTLIPAIVWALAWAVLALLLIAAAIWSTWLRPYLPATRGSSTLQR